MRWAEFAMLAAVAGVTGGIFWWLPRMRRGGLFFGNTVAEGFRESAAGHAIRNTYRRRVLLGTVATLILEFAVTQDKPGPFAAFAPLLQVAVCLVAWIRAFYGVRPYRASPVSQRSAVLEEQEEPGPLWLVAVLSPLLALGAAAAYLYSIFGTLPSRYPVHWNAAGEADRFADRSAGSVFLGLFIGTGVIMLMAANVYLLLYYTRRSPDGRRGWSSRYLSLNLRAMTVLSWGLSAVFVLVSLAPVFPESWRSMVFLGVLVLPLGLIAAILIPMMKLSEEPTTENDLTPDACWKAGIFYYNPDDPAIMVPKRDGLGYSLNFALRPAWFIVAMMLSLAALPILLGLSLK